MIRGIVRSSLRFRLLIIGIAVGVLVAGVTQLRSAPVDVLPEFTPPYAEIQTEALGLSADEVEQLITVPLEADLLNGVEGVEVIRSESLPGLSSIVLVFEQGTDIYRARQLVEERLTQAHALPHVSEAPTLLQPLSSSSRVVMIGLSSESLSPTEQSLIARWTLRPRLMGVPGVANVAIWGQRDEQLQVQVDPEQLRDRKVTLSQVIRTAGNAQVVSPLSFLEGSTPGTGGFIETPQQRLQVRNVFDKIADPRELGKVPVEGAQGRMRLSDVSKIRVGHQPLIGDAVVGDGDGLVLVVEKFPGASTPEVTEGVEEALDDLEPALAGLRTDTSSFRPASLVEDAIDNLTLTMAIAAALLVLVLVAFLFQWRTVAIALATIPVSLAAAALVLDLLGESFNAISFAGLAAAVAIVIDEAVVSAENVGRRLRRPAQGASTASRPAASRVLDATHEVRGPLAYATLIALLAMAPVAVMEGRPGAFFEPLALSYALAVVAAMVVALTLAPALSFMLFSKRPAGRDSALLRALAPRYGAALRSFIARPRTVLVVVGVGAVLGLAAVPFLDTSTVPKFKDRDVLVSLDAPPGTSNPRMTQIATSLGRELRALPGVDQVGAHIGRAKTGDQLVNVNSGELWVSLEPDADHDRTLASIEAVVDRARGVDHDVTTYTAERIRDVGALREGENAASGNDIDVLTGSDEPLVVRVYGQDLATLRREARRALRVVSRVDGVENPKLELPVTQATIEIETDLGRAQRFGVKPGDVRRAEAALIQGIHVGSIFKEQKVFDVIVRGVPATRRSVASVRNLLLDRPGGGHVRLGQVADVRVGQTPVSIERDAVSRRLDIEAGVSGRSLDAVAGDVENRLSTMRFPLEYHAEVLKRTAADEIDATRMVVVAIAAALAAFLLFQAAFRSWSVAALVFLAVPLSLVGGLAVALVSGAELSLGSLLGLLAVLVLATRTGLVLIRHMQDLAPESGRFGTGLVERGAQERLRPILTSAAAVAAVMLPFAVAGSPPGLEVVHPMATVVLGGLVTSTLLSLFVLPALYLRFGGRQPTLSPEEELMQRWADVDPAEEPVERAPLA
jgi:CzcA family heavy metal efflux pump